MTFSASGQYLVTGGAAETVRVWRVQDGAQIASMKISNVLCLAVSKDGKWTAAGTLQGAIVWRRGKIFRQIVSEAIHAVDFSPDSTQVVVASSNGTVTVWALEATLKQVQKLYRSGQVGAAKYSPHGDRIATATRRSVRIYDSRNGRFLIDIKVNVTPRYNTGLVWFNNYLFVVSRNTIKKFDASTGSAVLEWPVPRSDMSSCIALSQRGEFIAYSADRTVTFWDTSTHTQLGLIQYPQYIYWIALSADNRFLAIGGEGGKIGIKSLSCIAVGALSLRITVYMKSFLTSSSDLYLTFQAPDIQMDDDVLDSWKRDRLTNVDTLLSARINESRNANQHLAARALIRVHLQQWHAALADAEKVICFSSLMSTHADKAHIKSIKIQPSVMGYIAKSVSVVCKGNKNKGYRICDIALQRFHSSHISFLLLVKACIVQGLT